MSLPEIKQLLRPFNFSKTPFPVRESECYQNFSMHI